MVVLAVCATASTPTRLALDEVGRRFGDDLREVKAPFDAEAERLGGGNGQ